MTGLPFVGPYMLHRRIAKGGMAEVFLASRTRPDGGTDIVAVKCIRPEFVDDPSFTLMFLDEARISSGLSHPAITRLLDFGEHEGRPYLAMEFVAGASVKVLVKQGPFPPALATEVAARIAEALHSAHEQRDHSGQPLGIVHRDVTPQNVMVAFDGRVKLLDFGIALARVRAERTRTGVLKGKWSYMSPEQVQGRKIDRRADLFSLGALYYEMMTGQRAFDGPSPTEVLGAVMLRHPRPISEVVDGVPPSIAAALARLLAKEKDKRFQTGEEAAAALGQVLAELRARTAVEDLGAYVRRVAPGLHEQVESTRREVESLAARCEADPLDGPTVVQPAPFEQAASDLDASEGSDLGPAAWGAAAAPERLPARGPLASEQDEDEETPAVGLGLVLTVVVGVALGLGLAALAWALGAI